MVEVVCVQEDRCGPHIGWLPWGLFALRFCAAFCCGFAAYTIEDATQDDDKDEDAASDLYLDDVRNSTAMATADGDMEVGVMHCSRLYNA